MTDRYTQIANAPVAGTIVKNLGLPTPQPLERHTPGRAVIEGAVLLGAAPGGSAAGPVAKALASIGAPTSTPMDDGVRTAAADAGLDAAVFNPEAPAEARFKAIVYDATGISASGELAALHRFFGPVVRRLEACGRIVVLGRSPDSAGDPKAQTAQRALEGFARSAAKEARRGATCQLVQVTAGAEDQLESTLRFLLSPRSAYVSGQVVRVTPSASRPEVDWGHPLAGRVALVTGSARGIGAEVASVLSREGAHVICLDIPALSGELSETARRVEGTAIELDITSDAAPETIADHVRDRHGGLDVLVHNAGITRDRTIGKMSEAEWDSVLSVNLTSEERINDALVEGDLLKPDARIVCVSSISGIAGNAGQANYATSKAGVIGMVESLAPVLADRPATINAVAPGFIETKMTAAMPIAIREAGRRMNSLRQGGLPVDVAETIAWLASPASAGLNGNVVRVCGQSLLGA